jgi:ribulose-5-phosphate 4-epimerase/fuculose-1-phosphate aldolase
MLVHNHGYAFLVAGHGVIYCGDNLEQLKKLAELSDPGRRS